MKEAFHIGYDLIIRTIPAGVKVLDLGCGYGELLEKLQKEKKVRGFGVEISEAGVAKCVEKGLYCYQGDIDEGLIDYQGKSFDYVILNQTLQNTRRPDHVMFECLRIGKKVIVSFPNFAYISARFQLLAGSMPKSKLLPYEWYESPNIHLVTISDFRNFCRASSFTIERELHFSMKPSGRSITRPLASNLFAEYGFFILSDSSDR